MSISYEGIGAWCATFAAGTGAEEGKVVKVSANGTSAGMLIHAHTAISAAPIAQKHRSLVENFIRSPPIVKQNEN